MSTAAVSVTDDSLPWCITLDNSKGISRLRFWCKKEQSQWNQ